MGDSRTTLISVALDWGFNVHNGIQAYGQLCQDEALRYAYDLWQEGGHDPWRWERLSTGQFRLFGFPLSESPLKLFIPGLPWT